MVFSCHFLKFDSCGPNKLTLEKNPAANIFFCALWQRENETGLEQHNRVNDDRIFISLWNRNTTEQTAGEHKLDTDCTMSCIITGTEDSMGYGAWQITSDSHCQHINFMIPLSPQWHHNIPHFGLVHHIKEQGHIPFASLVFFRPYLSRSAIFLLPVFCSAPSSQHRSQWRFCFLRDELLS